jgi:hypothetical protein
MELVRAGGFGGTTAVAGPHKEPSSVDVGVGATEAFSSPQALVSTPTIKAMATVASSTGKTEAMRCFIS